MKPVPPVYMTAREAALRVGLNHSAISSAYSRGTIRAAAFVGEKPLFNDEVVQEYVARRIEWDRTHPNGAGIRNRGNSTWGKRLREARTAQEQQAVT